MLDQAPSAPDRARTHADLRASFADVDPGSHLALFYRSTESQLRVVAAFVADALHRDRRCLYLTDANDPATVRGAFADVGIDVAARIDAGDLEIRPASEVYLEDGFDAERTIETLEAASSAAIDDGYAGLTAAGENTWSFRTEMNFDDLVDFEAAFDACAHTLPSTTLCQYNLDRFDEESIAKAVWSHEYILYRETLCPNPYYVAPDRYHETADPAMNAQLMLEQTYRLALNRREIERHQQRLSVVNRILRHDIRNDLNLVHGSLDRIREAVADDSTASDRLDVVDRVVDRLVDRAEKARYVQRTLADSGVESVDLTSVVDRAVAQVRQAHPATTITVDAAEDATALADRNLQTALVELLTNAIVHQTDDDPSVSVTVTRSPDTVTVEVANPGPPIPENDRRALLQDVETQLEHGDGLGLWLVKWITDNSRGTLRFPDRGGDACRIAIELQAVDG